MSIRSQGNGGDGDIRMTLFEHLSELRSRLLRVVIAVVVLGAASLAFARPLFGMLMRPVLDALPPDARSLIYTSGIEEVNVLMKVGLYAGVFLATPVLLWQIWGFISPGLYPSERKFAGPFVFLGTLAFLVGAAFCYLVILPTMFDFLLQEPDAAAMGRRVAQARLGEDDALRALRFGDLDRASTLAKAASASIADDVKPHGLAFEGADRPSPSIELAARLEGLGRLMDAVHEGFGTTSRPVLRGVMDKRQAAVVAFGEGNIGLADQRIEEASSALAGVSASNTSVFGELWKLERELSIGRARHAALNWTRPMLSMNEQLTLVLMLEVAFGLIFELPLIMALLSILGLVKSSFLFKYQRHAFVICMILAAVITPTGDAVNLSLMMGPMFLCYELGVLASWLIEKRRARDAASTELAPPG